MNEAGQMSGKTSRNRGWKALVWSLALLVSAGAGMGAGAAAAQEGGGVDANPGAEPSGSDAEPAAWMPVEGRTPGQAMDALIDSANERYARSQKEMTEGIELELLEDFEAFAVAWAGTDEAVLALIQSATLAGMADEFDRAEANLNRAAELTDDPEFEYEINRGLASIRVRPGGKAPAFTVQTVDARTITPADYEGKVLLLDFWATWCAPCIAELPNLKKVYEEFHPKGLEVVSISLDSDRPYFDRFIKEQGMAWTHVYEEAQAAEQKVADRYGVVSIPRMILVGPDGTVLASQLRGEELNEAVAKAVEALK